MNTRRRIPNPNTRARRVPPAAVHPRMRRASLVVRGLLITIVAAVVVFAAAAGTPGPGQLGAKLTATSSDGSFTMSNSKDGAAIFNPAVSNAVPGQSTGGSVTVANTGTRAGSFSLSLSNLSGAVLANQLDMAIIRDGSTPIYFGKLGTMAPIALGAFQPGESHTYSFTATLPQSSDNSVQGSTMSVEYDWNATAPNPPASGGGGGGTVIGGGGSSGGGVGADHTPPTISGFGVSAHTFFIGSLLPRLARTPVGTTISFKLSEKATVTLSYLQYASGRKKGSRCLLKQRTGKRCTITYTRGKLVVSGKKGLNKLRFQGRLSRSKTLKPGRYTMVISAKDAAGNVSKSQKTTLTLKRK